jgi:hypothetical protein
MPKFPSNRNFQALQIRDLIDPILSRWKDPAIYSLFDSNSAQEILQTRISSKIDLLICGLLLLLGDSLPPQLINLLLPPAPIFLLLQLSLNSENLYES